MNTREQIRQAATGSAPAPKVAAPAQSAQVAKPAAEPKAPREPKPKAEPKACACQVPGDKGCNGGKTNRYFAPGHDAKLVGYLTREVVAGRMDKDAAITTLDERSGSSATLLGKLKSAIVRETDKAAKKAAKSEPKADESKMEFAREQAERAKEDLKAKRDAE